MSQEQGKQVSFQEYVIVNRGQIIVAYDDAKALALSKFDDLAKRLDDQFKLNEALKSASVKNPVEPKIEKDSSRNKKK